MGIKITIPRNAEGLGKIAASCMIKSAISAPRSPDTYRRQEKLKQKGSRYEKHVLIAIPLLQGPCLPIEFEQH